MTKLTNKMKNYKNRLELFEVVNIDSDSEFRSKIMNRDDIVDFVKEELNYDNCDHLDNESITNIIRNHDYEVYSLQKSYPECFGLEEDEEPIGDLVFNKKDLIDKMIKVLEEYDIYDYKDILHLAFYEKSYVEDEDKAKELVKKYGYLNAVEDIINYELDEYGVIYTKFTNNITIISRLSYITAEKLIYDKLDFIFDLDEVNEENNKIIIEKLKEML